MSLPIQDGRPRSTLKLRQEEIILIISVIFQKCRKTVLTKKLLLWPSMMIKKVKGGIIAPTRVCFPKKWSRVCNQSVVLRSLHVRTPRTVGPEVRYATMWRRFMFVSVLHLAVLWSGIWATYTVVILSTRNPYFKDFSVMSRARNHGEELPFIIRKPFWIEWACFLFIVMSTLDIGHVLFRLFCL